MSAHFRFDTQGATGATGATGPMGPPGPSALDCSNIVDVSGIYFCNGTSITTFSGECITISGCLDMSCNSIVDVSQVDFCNDIVLTKPSGGGIAIGDSATGYLPALSSSISIGASAGNGLSRFHSIAIGQGAGNTDQQKDAIAIGHIAGVGTQGEKSIALGHLAGGTSQGQRSIAIGSAAGFGLQGIESIAIGNQAGLTSQSSHAIAIGHQAGGIRQDPSAIAIGSGAGKSDQSYNSIAIGTGAGNLEQDTSSIAIGYLAGATSQGTNSIAIGYQAGLTNQHSNSIILNAQETALNSAASKTFYVKPIREDVSNNVLYYDHLTGEITYSIGGHGGLDLDCSNIIDVSGIYFCNGTNLTTFVPAAITMSGNFIQGSSNTLNLPPTTTGEYSHVEGANNNVSAIISHAEGSGNTIATGVGAPCKGNHAEGLENTTESTAIYCHVEGQGNNAGGKYSHVEGYQNDISGWYSHGEGFLNFIDKDSVYCHVEGYNNECDGSYNHVEGRNNDILVTGGVIGQGAGNHIEGHGNSLTIASVCHMEGSGNVLSSLCLGSHVEGFSNTINNTSYGHVEGILNTMNSGSNNSHAEGQGNNVTGGFAHAEGQDNDVTKDGAHVEGMSCLADARYSHAEGHGTIIGEEYSHATGYYNDLSKNVIFVVGCGTGPLPIVRKDAFWIDKDCGTHLTGGLDVSCSDITDVSSIFFCNDTCISGNVQDTLSISGDFNVNTSATGALALRVNAANNISVVDGTESVPAVNFGVGGAADTGMYLPLTDAVGFSTGGVNKVGILKADSAPYINGLNVGTTAVIAGIQRLSAVAANSWEDGHMGNSSQIVFTPTDMVIGNGNLRGLQVQSSQPDPQLASSRWYGATCENGIIVCQKVIPKGFSITPGNETITIYTPAGLVANTTCYISAQAADIASTTLLTNLSSHVAGSGTALSTNATTILNGWHGRNSSGRWFKYINHLLGSRINTYHI